MPQAYVSGSELTFVSVCLCVCECIFQKPMKMANKLRQLNDTKLKVAEK